MNKKNEQEHISDQCTVTLTELVRRVARVRKRLVLEAILKTLAMGLILLPVYVVLYAYIDHHFHLSALFRTVALAGLVTGIGLLLLHWAQTFLSHISLSLAANYVESKRSYQQQLVATIEYYEQEADYPYSRGLAEQMICQLDHNAREDQFTSTVKLWPSLISAAVILCAIVSLVFLINNHYQYYSRYFARLVKPVARVEPLPPTDVRSVTEDIIAEPGEPLTLIAAIDGRIPESGTLYIESNDVEKDPNNPRTNQPLTTPLLPSKDSEDHNVFQARLSLREKGFYTYYFETGKAQTNRHKIQITDFPDIQSIAAEVAIPASQWVKPYTENVKDFSLSVFEGAHVTLNIKTSQPLKDIEVTLQDEQKIAGQLQHPDEFVVAFKTLQEGAIHFILTNADGLKNRKPLTLQMHLKQDHAPEFKLISPDGDYIADNVASIPIEFEVSDDFALQSASLHLEFNNGKNIRLPAVNMEPGCKKYTLSCLLELEDYDLDISDSVIFYASAQDVNTGIGAINQTAWSTPYFIEIRPYRKIMVQPDPSLPSMEKQGMQAPRGHEAFLSILEYNRAFLKKTWLLSQKKDLDDNDKFRLNAISDDVNYTGQQLAMIRDDPKYDFTSEQIGTINTILGDYDQAVKTLVKYQPVSAVPPEKQAYHKVRGLIKELMDCPPPVAGMKPETRDKLELKDPIHMTRYEKERIEWQLEKLAQELAKLAKEQDQLKQEFVKFLEEQNKKKLEQTVNDAQSWTEKHETEISRSLPPENPETKSSDNGNTLQGAMVNLKNPPSSAGSKSGQPQTSENKDEPLTAQKDSGRQNDNNQKASEKEQNQKGQGNGQIAANDMLRIMQSQQKASKNRLQQLSEQLAQMPIPDEKIRKDGTTARQIRQAAQKHLEKANAYMDRVDSILTDQYYQPQLSQNKLEQAGIPLEGARFEINQAELKMAEEYADSRQQLAMESESLALKLETMADAYDKSVSETEKQKLQIMLKDATALLKSLPEDYWKNAQSSPKVNEPKTTNNQDITPPNQIAANKNTVSSPGSPAQNASAGSGRSASLVSMTTRDLSSQARLAARHFWSVAINARKRATPLTETQYTHPEFSEQENRFFEQTATYANPQEQP